MQETWVPSLGQKDPLEKRLAIHSLQYSCLGNPKDRGAWWATFHGVTYSQTRPTSVSQTDCLNIRIFHPGW